MPALNMPIILARRAWGLRGALLPDRVMHLAWISGTALAMGSCYALAEIFGRVAASQADVFNDLPFKPQLVIPVGTAIGLAVGVVQAGLLAGARKERRAWLLATVIGVGLVGYVGVLLGLVVGIAGTLVALAALSAGGEEPSFWVSLFGISPYFAGTAAAGVAVGLGIFVAHSRLSGREDFPLVRTVLGWAVAALVTGFGLIDLKNATEYVIAPREFFVVGMFLTGLAAGALNGLITCKGVPLRGERPVGENAIAMTPGDDSGVTAPDSGVPPPSPA